MASGGETVVEMRGITKCFGGMFANDDIDFDLKRGEIHALLGENGAGKTTLMNILSGMYHPDSGEIFIKGKKVRIGSPRESLELGIGMVYQHLTLVPTLSVLENIFLGTNRKFLLPKKEAEKRVRAISKKYGIDVDPHVEIWQLSAGEQERVEILKLFYRGSDVLILDEPTSVLSPIEIDDFFAVLKSMADAGKSVIFITHKIEEALFISDRVTILKKGVKGGEIDLSGIDIENEGARLKEKIVGMMFKDASFSEAAKEESRKISDRVVLALDGIVAKSDRDVEALKKITFDIHEGEIFGIAGVDGNGQKELAEVIAGQRKVESGTITLNETEITNRSIRFINEMGVFYVTEDRIEEGSVANFSLAENAIFRCYRNEPFAKSGILLNMDRIKNYCDGLIESYSIKAQSSDTIVKTLSGGNIQKLILAREFSYCPAVLICNKPTHGLDVMTMQYIRNELKAQSEKGVSVLMISSDLDEIKEVSDRIGVIFKGEIIQILPNRGTSKKQIGRLMLGITD
ncbi:MAG: ABC transporter ATP-binding protein [Spirochaetes bacterium]|nr:ABC transporter ATP-binding protein [Spirochaetota bacterium]